MHGSTEFMTGLVGGAYSLGTGAGPLAGAFLTTAWGLEWAAGAYGISLFVLAAALTTTLLVSQRRWRASDTFSETGSSDEDDFYSIV